ncbi:MAG: peptidylprolyl isomerase [Treponema sp.]|nr:peptidylprolyl isomerase [Treponema sp.]
MNIIKNRVVGIGYTLTDTNNRFIDSAALSEPLFYLHGYENLIPGLERTLEGKTEGDTFKITLPAADAYGNRDLALISRVPLDQFEDAGEVEVGMQFAAHTAEGHRLVTVTAIEDQMVTVDGNHPLSGMDLNFEVTVVSVRDAEAEEIAHGHPHQNGCHAGGETCGACEGCGDSCCGR